MMWKNIQNATNGDAKNAINTSSKDNANVTDVWNDPKINAVIENMIAYFEIGSQQS